MLFFDTETCGLHGPIVLLQYAVDDSEIILYEPWKNPVSKTLEILELFTQHDVVGFNLTFDWFHVNQLYTTMLLLDDKDNPPNIEEYAAKEALGRDGPCLRPRSACDIMLHARKGPYQSLMARKDIRIRRIPTPLAPLLARELESRIKYKEIYFSKRKDKTAPKWQVYDIKDTDDFKDVVLKFAPSSALKALATDIFDLKEVVTFGQIDVAAKMRPVELGYAPFATAIGQPGAWNGAWPDVIWHHIDHWRYNVEAREYAKKDIVYTRDIYYHFGSPTPGDDDSELACAIGASRWKGFAINEKKIKALKLRAKNKRKLAPTDPKRAREYLYEVMDPTEKLILGSSTRKQLLKEVTEWKADCECNNPDCPDCRGTGEKEHPAAQRAKNVIAARQAGYRINFFNKLLQAGRLHADFKIVGALSGRMAGGGDLNAQGIDSSRQTRAAFTLAFPGESLCGGDASAFEVTIADAVYNDLKLREFIKTGGKIHGIFGTMLFPGHTYDQILATDGTSNNLYTKAKSGVFLVFYGGTSFAMKRNLGVEEDVANAAIEKLVTMFPGIRKQQQQVLKDFGALSQPGGIGSKVYWQEPKEFCETMFGFKRYFTAEIQTMRTLYEIANKVPDEWLGFKFKVTRRDREQTVSGAARSALIAAAFTVQGNIVRASTNHYIQGAGSTIIKRIQTAIWKFQPVGVHPWKTRSINVHDELRVSVAPELVEEVRATVDSTIKSLQEKVPLLAMKWKTNMASWAEK